jgi:hypothetical protein
MEFLEALNEYYKLKNEYDTKKQAKINRILHDESLTSFKQKRDIMEKNKLQCIGCNQSVGTIFTNKNGILGAHCGNKNSPCDLNIQINRGKYIFLDYLIDIYNDDVITNKEKIIQVKLDLLFNFKNEITVLNTFNTIKDELIEDLETLTNYKTRYVSTLSNLSNRSELNVQMEQFYNIVETIKASVQEFNETNNIQLIKDVVTIYRKDMEPILKKLQELQYKYMAIEFNETDETYCLVRKSYTLDDMSVPFDEPKVIKFQIGNKSNKQYNSTNSVSTRSDESEEYLL